MDPVVDDPLEAVAELPALGAETRQQIRLKSVLLVVGLLAVLLAAIRYRWMHPLVLFPFLYVAGVAGGVAMASLVLPTRPWFRLIGGMFGSALATTMVIFAMFAVEFRDPASLRPAMVFSGMMFVPAMIAGGATCLCWEAFLQRHSNFLPRLRRWVRQ